MIKLIIGPMFASKTSELIRLLVRASIAGKKVILLRPETDTRDFLTHDGKSHELEERFVSAIDPEKYKDYDVIGIEEGQFFEYTGNGDVLNTMNMVPHDLNYLANQGKEVIVAALNGTSERTPFNTVQELIPHAENIIKLNAICIECGSEYGSFSYFKKGRKTDKVTVGDGNEYSALCRQCYNKHFKQEM